MASTRPTWSLPWRTCSGPEPGGAPMSDDRFDRAAVGAQPRPAGGARAGHLRHRPPWTTTWPRPPRRPPRLGLALEHLQTNHEGDLVEAVHAARGRADAIIVNAGALSHTSWSLHDALAAFDGVVVELHLSNPAAREPFRHTVGHRPGVRRVHRRVRRARLPPGRRGRATSCWPTGPEPPMSAGARGPVAPAGGDRPHRPPAGPVRRGGTTPEPAIERAAGDHPGQHPVAERLHRIGRPPAGDRRRRPAHHRRTVPDPVRRAAGRGRRATARSTVSIGGVQVQREALVARGRCGRLARARGRSRHLVGAADLGRSSSARRRWSPPGDWSRGCGWSRTPAEVARMERAAAIADQALAAVLPLLAAAGTGADRRSHRVAVRRRPRPRHAPGRAPRRAPSRPSWPRGRTRPSPTPAPGDRPHPGRRPGGGRLRRRLRRLPVGHDPHLLCRAARPPASWPPCSRWWRSPSGPGWRSVAPGVTAGDGRPGLPRGDRRVRMGRAVRARHRARGRARHPRGAVGRPGVDCYPRCPAPWSPWNRACTCPGPAGSASRTPWW